MKAITLEDAAVFNRALAVMDTVSCEMSFANLFLWSMQSRNRFKEYKGRLLVESAAEDFLFFPIGDFLPPAELAGFEREIYDVPPQYIERYPETADFFEIETSADYADYIYDLGHLAGLAGPKLRKKRNLIRQFLSEYPDAAVGEVTPGNLPEFTRLAERLFASLEPTETLKKELAMWPNVLEHLFAPELRLGSLTLSSEGEMIGFAVYSPLGQGCFDIHFEKTDHNIKGAPQYLVQQLAIKLSGLGKLMNREQDLGLPGLRHAKESLDPLYLYRRSILTPR